MRMISFLLLVLLPLMGCRSDVPDPTTPAEFAPAAERAEPADGAPELEAAEESEEGQADVEAPAAEAAPPAEPDTDAAPAPAAAPRPAAGATRGESGCTTPECERFCAGQTGAELSHCLALYEAGCADGTAAPDVNCTLRPSRDRRSAPSGKDDRKDNRVEDKATPILY